MFKDFINRSVPLDQVYLDSRNPRIISDTPITDQNKILSYLLEHENLRDFAEQICRETKNPAAERPYVVEENGAFVVIEGNSRIAAYKLITGLLSLPDGYVPLPSMAEDDVSNLRTVDVSVAPNRERLMPILAKLHFGKGDKSGWTFLSSRKSVFEEFSKSKSIDAVARVFEVRRGQVVEWLIEWDLYQKACSLPWSGGELLVLKRPRLEFNQPIRFLETKGHLERVGLVFDRNHCRVEFVDDLSRLKFQHLIRKLVVDRAPGLKATSRYDEVFRDFVEPPKSKVGSGAGGGAAGSGSLDAGGGGVDSARSEGAGQGQTDSGEGGAEPTHDKSKHLLDLAPKRHSALLEQLCREARTINHRKFPGAATLLLRTLVEAVLLIIIEENTLNVKGDQLNLEKAINIVKGAKGLLSKDDRKILDEFVASGAEHLNLVAHATLRPHQARAEMIAHAIEPFLRKYC